MALENSYSGSKYNIRRISHHLLELRFFEDEINLLEYRMKVLSSALLMALLLSMTACSRKVPAAEDLKKICDHISPLVPVEKKPEFVAGCEKRYEDFLSKCTNASALTSCFANIKSWDERWTCVNSCEIKPETKK